MKTSDTSTTADANTVIRHIEPRSFSMPFRVAKSPGVHKIKPSIGRDGIDHAALWRVREQESIDAA